jgi:hypothetical protein
MSTRPAPRRRAFVSVLLLVPALLLAGCTSDVPAASGAPDTDASDTGATEPPSLRVRAEVTLVAGGLSPRQRRTVARQAEATVLAYVEAAFLGDYPRSDGFGDAFPGFTPGARALARKDAGVLTGRRFADAAEVTATAASAYVSVVAPDGRPVGATARVSVDLEVLPDRGEPRPVRLRGRLLLTPSADGWRVFGYDLSRSDLGSIAKAGS